MLVAATGIIGAVLVAPLMNALGIGTARAFQVNELAGTFAGIGMGLNGALTALFVSALALLL